MERLRYIRNRRSINEFTKNFLWGGATAANQCEGGYREENRGLANVDVIPAGKDRFDVCLGKKIKRKQNILQHIMN